MAAFRYNNGLLALRGRVGDNVNIIYRNREWTSSRRLDCGEGRYRVWLFICTRSDGCSFGDESRKGAASGNVWELFPFRLVAFEVREQPNQDVGTEASSLGKQVR